MVWHGQINRTMWEIGKLLEKKPRSSRLRRELLRTHFLQRYEYDRAFHIPRDDRSFLFLQEDPAPVCLLLHGAQGTPAEMRDIGNFLYAQGFSCYCPRHSRLDMKDRMVSWESWVTGAESALKVARECSRETYVIGMSLGATIAIIISSIYPVKGMALLAPAIYPKYSLKERFIELGKRASPTLFYRFAGWNGEVVKAMEFVRKNLKRIEVPVLVLQARDDARLSTRGLKILRRAALHPKSEVILLPFGSHVLTRGVAREEVFQRIHDFFQRI